MLAKGATGVLTKEQFNQPEIPYSLFIARRKKFLSDLTYKIYLNKYSNRHPGIFLERYGIDWKEYAT